MVVKVAIGKRQEVAERRYSDLTVPSRRGICFSSRALSKRYLISSEPHEPKIQRHPRLLSMPGARAVVDDAADAVAHAAGQRTAW